MKQLSIVAMARTLKAAVLFARGGTASAGGRLQTCSRWRHLLDGWRHVAIRMPDGAMAPTLPAGCEVKIDPALTAWEPQSIVAVATGEDLVVARAGEDAGGRPVLVHDNPAWPDLPLPQDARIMGRVCCLARMVD